MPLATDAPRPLPPQESLRRFQLPTGFHVELVASEPLVADPVAMAFDAQGRIFVCEIHGYNLEGYLDALQQNKTGVLDKAVRRIPANADAQREAAEQQYGTVKLLEDTDGDGRMDRVTVWADRLPPLLWRRPSPRWRDRALCPGDYLPGRPRRRRSAGGAADVVQRLRHL